MLALQHIPVVVCAEGGCTNARLNLKYSLVALSSALLRLAPQSREQDLTGAKNHPGKWGNDWGTGYFPTGNKAGIGAGVAGIVFGGIGVVYWSAWRQFQKD